MARTVLVVDDDEAMRDFVRSALEDLGYGVAVAEDGISAVAAVIDAAPDAVIIDLVMPGLPGDEVIRQLRQSAEADHLPVLVCSSRTDEATRRTVREAGADGFLAKPVTQERLAEALEAILG